MVHCSIFKETIVENIKPLVVLVTSLVTAYSPLHDFLHYDWNEWIPFLEVLKTSISIIGVIASTILIILNYFKKNKKTK